MSLLDVFDTALELLDVRPPSSRRDGTSMASALLSGGGNRSSEREYLLHLDIESGSGLALIQGSRKLIVAKKPYGKQLFDLDRDPQEVRDLFADPKEAATARELLAEVARIYNDYSKKSMKAEHALLSASTARKLMALGYLAPAGAGRRVPIKILEPTMDALGSLGWEGKDTIGNCVQVAEASYEGQLLSGWYYPELQGRWTEPSASLLLRVPQTPSGSFSLSLAGESFRPDAARVRVSMKDRVLLDRLVEPGGFRIESEVHLDPAMTALAILSIEPSFQPAKQGSLDHRNLGIFLRSICIDDLHPKAASWIARTGEPPGESAGSNHP